MIINLCPMRSDTPLSLHRSGDVLLVNGEAFDFSAIPEGATLPRAAVSGDWLASDIERIGGQLRFTVILPHSVNAPPETRFPVPLSLTNDGPVSLPPFETPLEEIPA